MEAALARERRWRHFAAVMTANLMNVHLQRAVSADDLLEGRPARRQRKRAMSDEEKRGALAGYFASRGAKSRRRKQQP